MEDDEAKLRTRVHDHFVLVKSKKGIKEIFKQAIDLANDNDSWLYKLQVAGLGTYCCRYKSAKAAIREAARTSSFPKWSDAVWEGHIFHLVSDNMALEKAFSAKKKTDKEVGDSTSSVSLIAEEGVAAQANIPANFACFESTSKVKTTDVSHSEGSYSGSDDEDDASSHGEEMTTTMEEDQRAVSGAQEGRSSALTFSDKEEIANTSTEKSSSGEKVKQPIKVADTATTHQNLGVAAVLEPPLAVTAGALDPQKLDISLPMNKSTMGLEKRTSVGPFPAANRTNGWGGFTTLHDNSSIPNDDVGPQQPAVLPSISAGALDPQKLDISLHLNKSTMGLEKRTSVGPFSAANRTNGWGGFTTLHDNSSIHNDDVGPQQPAVLPPSIDASSAHNQGKTSTKFSGSNHGSSWANLFSTNPKSSLKLQFLDPGTAKSQKKLFIPKSIAQRSAEWASCLVGYFVGTSPIYSLVSSLAHMHWSKLGLKEVLVTEERFFFFKFSTFEQLNVVLEGGPWDFSGKPIFLRKWTRNLKLGRETKTKVPIWAKFYNIPLEFWCKDGLSMIGSMIGNPLSTDLMTETCQRISYAHIYLEIDVDSDLVSKFEILAENDDGGIVPITIRVEYKWIPPKCLKCKCFGHDCNTKTPTFLFKSSQPKKTAIVQPKKTSKMEWIPVNGKDKGKDTMANVIDQTPLVNKLIPLDNFSNDQNSKGMRNNMYQVLGSFDTECVQSLSPCTPHDTRASLEKVVSVSPNVEVIKGIMDDETSDSFDDGSSHEKDLYDDHPRFDTPSSSKKTNNNSKKKRKNKKKKR